MGVKVVIASGPTREPLDPVRYLSNRSSGLTGLLLARRACELGMDTLLVTGPVCMDLSREEGLRVVDVETACQMHEVMLRESLDARVVIMAAAVADFRPEVCQQHKMKKRPGEEVRVLKLVRNPDILADLGARKPGGQYLVGFAAETQEGEWHAREKLRRKGADLIVLNEISEENPAFDVPTNRVSLIPAGQSVRHLPTMEKAQVAKAIWDLILEGLEAR